jgi:hypothetical protein
MPRWQRARAAAGGKFLKFADGDTNVLAFIGEPEPKRSVWTGTSSVAPDSADGKAAIAAGAKPRRTFEARVRNLSAAGAIQIWSMSVAAFDSLAAVVDKRDPERWAFSISRRGSGVDTRYTVIPERELTASETVHLRGLANEATGAPPPSGLADSEEDNEPDQDLVPF